MPNHCCDWLWLNIRKEVPEKAPPILSHQQDCFTSMERMSSTRVPLRCLHAHLLWTPMMCLCSAQISAATCGMARLVEFNTENIWHISKDVSAKEYRRAPVCLTSYLSVLNTWFKYYNAGLQWRRERGGQNTGWHHLQKGEKCYCRGSGTSWLLGKPWWKIPICQQQKVQ